MPNIRSSSKQTTPKETGINLLLTASGLPVNELLKIASTAGIEVTQMANNNVASQIIEDVRHLDSLQSNSNVFQNLESEARGDRPDSTPEAQAAAEFTLKLHAVMQQKRESQNSPSPNPKTNGIAQRLFTDDQEHAHA